MANPAISGLETLQVQGQDANGLPSGQTFQTTTGAIAALASTESSPIVETAITTVGNGTLTAAALVGGQIARSGPTGVFTDTTATAAQIVAALPGLVVGSTFLIRIKNTTAFTETLAAGTGVTLPATVIIPAFSFGWYYATINSATAVTLTHMGTSAIADNVAVTAPTLTALTTVGAGTITAAGIVAGYTARTGSTAAFADTTDTAANIIAAQPGMVNKIGTAFIYVYANQTGFAATIGGGTGVTVSGVTVVAPGGTATFLITYTAAATLTMVGFDTGRIATLPVAQFSTGTTATTFTASELTGADYVVYTNTQATPGSIATRTATQMIGDIPNAYAGQTWVLRVVNGQGTGTLTITAGSGVTLTGTATVAANTTRDFYCTITNTGTPAITIQNIGTGTFS